MNRNLIVISLILVLVSCKKEKPTNNSLSEKMQLLTSQEWVAQKVEERKGNGPWEDVFPQFPACIKDNRFKFNADFTIVYSEGPIACASLNPVLETQSWKFNNDGTAIIIGGIENKILYFDTNKLKVLISEKDAGIIKETRNTFIR
ncbi:MAG: hypothetical protein CUR34_12870 [Sediminibacterium sp.]|jgi:hypothetical protein|nr:MAG: hypothetical protein CUR34_12870 [Sediminibacterium sp.] [Sediminibacterium sp. FEMGT703S]